MNARSILCILCLVLMLLPGCRAESAVPAGPAELSVSTAKTVPQATEPLSAESTAPPDPLAQLLEEMTLREKVGQLFIVAPEALTENSGTVQYGITALTQAMRDTLAEYPAGGVIQFAGNIVSPIQIAKFNTALRGAVRVPMFLAVDEEGGAVARLANHSAFELPRYRSAASVGSSGDPAAALEMGAAIGSYLKNYGFNMDMAPVADVNTNPRNPVIGSRAFSSDPEIAARMADAFAQGLREQSIIPVFKHFPGHGDTAQDSHSSIAVSHKTMEQLEQCEWLPFLKAGSNDCVMVGHIALPQVTGEGTPATLSYQIVTDILKGQLGFEGLVITDSLQMGAITAGYSSGEAAVLALQAGCDILLMPENYPEAFDAVLAAIEDGTLDSEWLDDTVRKILEFKQRHGLLN